ncbi:MAG: adenylate/guanylate cyclase domain-containing protein [Mesorhizobium sp.]
MIGKDEAGTIAALRGHLAAMAPVMAAHGGSIVNTAGDSVLAEFGSVVNAVSCAAALQQLLAERNAETDASRCLRFRIGVNQGEIVHETGEVYGDGVNGSAAAPPAVLDAAREAGSKALELDPAGKATSTASWRSSSSTGAISWLPSGSISAAWTSIPTMPTA